MLPDEGSIYPPPVLRKDIMKLQLFMGCFARKKVRHDSTNSSNGNSKKNNKSVTDSLKRKNSYGFVIFVRKCQKDFPPPLT